MQPTQLIWSAAGSPTPFDMDGEPIPKAKTPSHCACCNSPDGNYDLDEVLSSSFTTVRNGSRLAGFGGRNYCSACTFCARTLRLRCISWFASERGVDFWRTRPETPEYPRPNALAALLNPPEPPFVCGMPLYGVKHGGEGHWQRTPWPLRLPDAPPGPPVISTHIDPLIRLQSKHVAIYARTAYSRDRYPVQVDDSLDFVLDRDLWLRLIDTADTVVHRCMADGVPPYPSKLALESLRLPSRVSPKLASSWRQITATIRPHITAPWWSLFCELYPTPEDTREKTNGKTKRTDKPRHAEESTDSAPSVVVPVASNGPKDGSGQTGKGKIQLSLF
jgi:hypothetical protein